MLTTDLWRKRAQAVTPNGSQTRSKAGLFADPIAVVRARQGHAWDIHGREYIDWVSGLCALTLGAGNDEVDDAVIRQIRDRGVTFPLSTRLEVEVAEQLLDLLDWSGVDQVRWVKTGSEATNAAMIVARAQTRRRRIVSIGYHGWHGDHHAAPDDLITLPMMSPAAPEFIDANTAGVLVEVLRDGAGKELVKGWCADVRARCREVGALFIMDEVVTGLRWAIGGATEYLALDPPDLACFGKGMANGYALAALIGGRRLMQHAVHVSSTFGGEGVGLAAAQATLRIYARDQSVEHLWRRGNALMNAVNDSPTDTGLKGYACHPQLFSDRPLQEVADTAAERGVLLIPSGLNPTVAHSDADIASTVRALAP